MQRPEARSDKRVVVIGGGTGVFTVLSGLRPHFKHLAAIVTMADDGGSTGILRDEFGILPPGDIRRALVALSNSDDKLLSELFNYRFTEGRGLSGHAFGNLMIAALERITGSFEKAIEEAGKILAIEGEVLPVTLKPTRLVAELENGQLVKGETNIDIPREENRGKIKRVFLEPSTPINPRAKRAIEEADLVILAPGDIYTSLIPNLIVEGVPKALKTTKAKVLYFINVMTKHAETHGFTAYDFLKTVTKYTGEGVIDYVAVNKTQPARARVKPYAGEKAWFVVPDTDRFSANPTVILTDLIRSRGFIRHDPAKIAALVKQLV